MYIDGVQGNKFSLENTTDSEHFGLQIHYKNISLYNQALLSCPLQ